MIMQTGPTGPATQRRVFFGGLLLTAGLALVGAACGADGQSTTGIPGAGGDGPVARGAALNVSAGCAACHGSAGEGGVGPAYVGLLGAEVELEDGSTIVADAAYLRRSIVDPSAEIAAGYTIAMPANTLTSAEVDDLVAWITSLD